MALDVLPHEIPINGVRYDLTLRKTGFGKGTHNAKWVIDNGDKRGHIVSGVMTAEMHTILISKLRALDYDPEVEDRVDNPTFHVNLNREAKNIRCSAAIEVTYMAAINEQLVEVEPTYQESNVMVVYELSEFQAPEGVSELVSIFRSKV